jgi:hypothetical protein
MPPNTVVVSRPSKWGNPFSVVDVLDYYEGDKAAAAADCVRGFKQFIDSPDSAMRGPWLRTEVIRKELRGKNLACWCKPGQPCHADVLLEIANAPQLLTPEEAAKRIVKHYGKYLAVLGY